MAAYRQDDLKVTCSLTECTPGSAPGPAVNSDYGRTFTFTMMSVCCVCLVTELFILLGICSICCLLQQPPTVHTTRSIHTRYTPLYTPPGQFTLVTPRCTHHQVNSHSLHPTVHTTRSIHTRYTSYTPHCHTHSHLLIMSHLKKLGIL